MLLHMIVSDSQTGDSCCTVYSSPLSLAAEDFRLPSIILCNPHLSYRKYYQVTCTELVRQIYENIKLHALS